jgi:hypothetical protein
MKPFLEVWAIYGHHVPLVPSFCLRHNFIDNSLTEVQCPQTVTIFCIILEVVHFFNANLIFVNINIMYEHDSIGKASQWQIS